ncbi:MAG: mobile mystery protein B, partial [Ignavibacteriota bacterium]
MGIEMEYSAGQTPLGEEEMDGLRRRVDSRNVLNALEEQNIIRALNWSSRITVGLEEILSEEFIKRVHQRMFGDVWSWAGSFRRTNKNIGVDKFEISLRLKDICNDCRFWIENKTFAADEIAVRFKHRIVLVHPFANGNGRHSRMIGDILISKYFKRPEFSWSGKSLISVGESRRKYIAALRKADLGDYPDLVT